MSLFRQRTLYIWLAASAVSASACKTASYQSIRDPIAQPHASPIVEAATPVPATSNDPAKISSPVVPSEPKAAVEAKVEEVEETFMQTGMSGNADILVVIDNSNSMTEEQRNLSTKLNDLLVEVKDTNWQIGVITTTVVVENRFDKCVLTLIKPSDSNFEDKFRRAVTPGVDGSAVEEGIRQAVNGLRCAQTPWIRPGSTVAVLIVSDEDNCSSNGSGCKQQPSSTQQYLIDYVEKDLGRTVGVNAGFYGIFSPPAAPCGTALNKATQYQKLVDYKANGSVNYGSICDDSYKETLQRISKNIAILLNNQFPLKQKPDEGSIVILGKKVDGSDIVPSDYKLNGSTLTFNKGSEPALKSEIKVRYKVTTKP